jgi:bacterioferritin-associated ferredoxin
MAIEHKKHVFRIFLLLGAVVVSALIVRIFLVPETFGRYGHYRAANLAEQAAREVRHGGNDSCGKCHEKIKELHDKGAHLPVPCEDCHDALATHVRDGKKVAEMRRTKSVTKLCARCHRDLAARRESFPRINIEKHVADQGATLSDTVCFDCHNPHNPAP